MPSLLDLLLELQTLDRVPRSGYALRGVSEPESISEHSFHLAVLVWTLASETPEIDRARALEIAAGPRPGGGADRRPAGAPPAAISPPAPRSPPSWRRRGDLLAPLDERALELFAEYQAGESPEARFVGACDKLQILIKAEVYEGWGAAGLGEFWSLLDDFPDGGFAAIRRLVGELRERRRDRAGS